jgi:hypothetical protein
MGWTQDDHGHAVIYLTGNLTNRGDISWHNVRFEGRFFDANGVMIDADYAHSDFTIRPNDQVAFRVEMWPAAGTNLYARYSLDINDASGERR